MSEPQSIPFPRAAGSSARNPGTHGRCHAAAAGARGGVVFHRCAAICPANSPRSWASIPPSSIKQCIEQLNESYERRQAAYRIEDRAGGYQLLTLPQYAQYIERLVKKKDEGRLTPASLETLAIVAFKQPLTRAGIEVIRGVACGEVLRSLMEHNLVKIVGRAGG